MGVLVAVWLPLTGQCVTVTGEVTQAEHSHELQTCDQQMVAVAASNPFPSPG